MIDQIVFWWERDFLRANMWGANTASGRHFKSCGAATFGVLASLGVVHRNPQNKDLWHLGPAMVQIAIAFQAHLASVHQRVADFEHNYTRKPY